MSTNKLTLIAGSLMAASAVISGMILSAGVLANMPGSGTLMTIGILALTVSNCGLIGFLRALGKRQ